MQTQTCLLQKSVKIYIYVNDISLISDLVYLCKKWTKKIHKNIQSYHLYTANDPEETYTGKHVELTVAQGASTKTAHFITKHYITFPGDLTAARSCRNFSKCNKVADKNLTQFKTFDECIYVSVFPLS